LAIKKIEALQLSCQEKRSLVTPDPELGLKRQCELLALNRSSFYYGPPSEESDLNQALMRLIDEIYTEHPYFGIRRIRSALDCWFGISVSRDRISRLMRLMGIEGKAPGRRTTVRHPGHKVYPNLLRNQDITRPNQAWCVDITYIPMIRGTMYLVCIMDWHSRKVLSWELSNSLDSDFCVRALEFALTLGIPAIFHSDQGCQFTSNVFTEILKSHHIQISMSGRGRCYDNIFIERFWRSLKTEEIYKHEFKTVAEVRLVIGRYIQFYNTQRPHQALDYATPQEVYDGAA
jgi:putative transposase